MRRLPSLPALRAFEAAARNASFSKGAEELFVTQAAISRSVRELETWLGKRLFRRLHRKVELTEDGEALQQLLERSFDELDLLLRRLREPKAHSLTVSVEPGFAAWWLTPRLDQFGSVHPDIDVVLQSTPAVVEHFGDVDLAIRYSMTANAWPGTETLHLATVRASALVSRRLLRGKKLQRPEDLLAFRLLHEDDRERWQRWFAAAGIPDLRIDSGPIFNDPGLILDAALRGHGVALADDVLAHDTLASGELLQPFDITIPAGAYWLVRPSGHGASPAARAFQEWLVSTFNAAAESS